MRDPRSLGTGLAHQRTDLTPALAQRFDVSGVFAYGDLRHGEPHAPGVPCFRHDVS
ncbi:hypothetical protein OG226_07070 [Streptomyces sp. NBC_01261]|uniref:hypothetical protein n=1 Tax=Streptomyces sp. NBC_01261 TaxID=2903802 RepID=UPI002E2F9143|nr:hypothetical protein [Streptomyces sp. NBC_01261]